VRWSFLSVALWWAVFSLPLLIWVREPEAAGSNGQPLVKTAFASVIRTAREISKHRNAWLFLLAYWLYIDGVATIIRMAVDYGLAIGLPSDSLIIALLLVQFIGFPATLVFGRIGERIGARKGLWIGLWVYVAATTYAAFMTTSLEFYMLAIVLGLVQGGVQSLSRSLFSHLIPDQKSGEFFGFMNMMGKAAAVVAPVLVGVVASTTGDSRLGIWSVLILFFSGMWVLRKVSDPTEKSLS
jgi:UMF1 family MFS transporter